MSELNYEKIRARSPVLRYDTPASRGRSNRRINHNSTPKLRSAEKYLNSLNKEDENGFDSKRYERDSSPIFLREQMKAESQVRAERDADLKTLRRSVSPKRQKSPKHDRSRSTSPIPMKYSSFANPVTPFEEYRSALSSLRSLRDNTSYIRSVSPPVKDFSDDISTPNLGNIVSGNTLDSGLGGKFHEAEANVTDVLNSTLHKSPISGLKSPTWHKLDKEGLQDAIEESEQRRLLLVNRLKDAQDTLKLQANTISSLKGEKERLKQEMDGLTYSKEESYNEKRTLTTRMKLLQSKCDELDEEVKELSRTSETFKCKMEDQSNGISEKNERINELENEISAIRLSSGDTGDQLSKLQESYDKVRQQAVLLEQQHATLTDDNRDLKHERNTLGTKCDTLNTDMAEAELAIIQLKSDLAIADRERRELEEARKEVISHKLDTQEELTRSTTLLVELQTQADQLIDARDSADKENSRLRDALKAVNESLASKDTNSQSLVKALESAQQEINTLREINDHVKDKVDVAQRARQDTDHLNQVLRGEKDELLGQKRDMFNLNEDLTENLKVATMSLADKVQQYDMMYEEKEDERKEKQQLAELLETLKKDSTIQKEYLETQCEDLETDVQKLTSENEDLAVENKRFTKELSDAKNNHLYNANKAEEWKNTAQSLEDSLNLSENERKGVVEDLLRIQNELTDLKDDYAIVADERNRFMDKYNELQRDCENFQEEVRGLLLEKDENQHVMRLLETQKAILDEKWNGGKDLDNAYHDNLELREDLKATRDRVKDLQQTADNLTNELRIAKGKVEALQGDKRRAQESIGRADKTIELLTGDKDRLHKQVLALTSEFERKVAGLEEELEIEQSKVLQRSQDNVGLKLRIDQALDSHGTEKSELIRERNELQDKITALERIREDLDRSVVDKDVVIGDLQTNQAMKRAKEGKLADALKAITGNPDVEDAFVQSAEYMRGVKREKEMFEKEAAKIPGLESKVADLEKKLDNSEQVSAVQSSQLAERGAAVEGLSSKSLELETVKKELEDEKQCLELEVEGLKKEKAKLDKLEVEHEKLRAAHKESLAELEVSTAEVRQTSDQRDSRDSENKRVKAENAKLSMELDDFKKALASKGDGERAMIEASNELRVVRGELENLMDLIATKDERIEELTYHIEEINDTVAQLKEEVEGKDAEIKTCRTQLRDADRQLERTGDLDLDSTAVVREKDEQVKRMEKWIENYKTKIENLERTKVDSDEEKSGLKEEKKGLEKQLRDLQETNKDEVVKRLHMTEDELRQLKQKLQMSEDDRSILAEDQKEMKSPEEVAKIIEDIKEAFEDEIADLLMSEREQYEKERKNFEREKEDFRVEQEEFLAQAEELAGEQMTDKNVKLSEMKEQLDSALSELKKYKLNGGELQVSSIDTLLSDSESLISAIYDLPPSPRELPS